MKIFVTGAGGFVGTRLVAHLRSLGHAVVGRDLDLDVRDEGALARALEDCGPDAVVHLAAMSSVVACREQPQRCFEINYLGTRALLRAALRVCPHARVLLVGSGDQYAATPGEARPCRESDPLRPNSPYSRTKACAELLGAQYVRRGLSVVRARSFNHTGPGQGEDFVAGSFAAQAARIAMGQQEPRLQVGNLESARDFLDVRDVLDAYARLLDPSLPARVYNIASGKALPIRVLLETLLELAGVDAEIVVDPARYRPTDALVGDATRLRAATGWMPRFDFRETLGALLDEKKALARG